MSAFWWLSSRGLGRSRTASAVNWVYRRMRVPLTRRITDVGRWKSRPMTRCAFPGWQPNGRIVRRQRPFVGTLTLELPTEADDEVASWIAAGTPPICFAFGSMSLNPRRDDRHDQRVVRAVG